MIEPIEIEIKPDNGVPVKRAPKSSGRPRLRDPVIESLVDKFAAMAPGQSFFVQGASKKELDFLRKPIVRRGLGYTMREVECDEIYQTAGVRVWRQHGEYDEL